MAAGCQRAGPALFWTVPGEFGFVPEFFGADMVFLRGWTTVDDSVATFCSSVMGFLLSGN